MEVKENKIKLYIADCNQGKEIAEIFKKEKKYEIIGVSADGAETLNAIKQEVPDVLIMDLMLPSVDGFALIENIERSNSLVKKPKIVVVSSLSHDGFITKAMQLGVSYFLIKPIDEKVLVDRVNDITSISNKSISTLISHDSNVENITEKYKAKIVEEKITNIFITVGIPAHIKGYHFLREAIKLAIESPDIINSITKKLYPAIAEKFETSPSKVERAIRHAIEVAWNRGKIENINTLFGLKVYNSNEKPTNGEFIALVADKMLIEGA
ncbi:MAG: sporulation transcription factor Spo0A [Clostridia bacterium]|nr:sporulation transcription factor Spo0A [Clostridia bacterium]